MLASVLFVVIERDVSLKNKGYLLKHKPSNIT